MNLKELKNADCFYAAEVPEEFLNLVQENIFAPGITFTSPAGVTYQFTDSLLKMDWYNHAATLGTLPVKRIDGSQDHIKDDDFPDPLAGFINFVTDDAPRTGVLVARAEILLRYRKEGIAFKLI